MHTLSAADADILVRRDGALLLLGLNRPARRNALTGAMYSELAARLEQAQAADSGVKAVLVHGAGPVFSAGNDITDFASPEAVRADRPVVRFLRALAAFELPLAAAVRGPAVGIGSTLLLHCDLVWAGDDAAFSFPFVNLGLCPEAGSSVLLPARIGRAQASEKLLFGEPFDAAEALRIGLVNHVLPAERVLDEAIARCRALCERPLVSLRATRALLRDGQAQAVDAAIDRELDRFAGLLRGPAAREAVQAFQQKRRPDFTAL